jgi:hypothetical protein
MSNLSIREDETGEGPEGYFDLTRCSKMLQGLRRTLISSSPLPISRCGESISKNSDEIEEVQQDFEMEKGGISRPSTIFSSSRSSTFRKKIYVVSIGAATCSTFDLMISTRRVG